MKKFISLKDFQSSGLPPDVAESVRESLQILDTYYGRERTENMLGGYALIVENFDDLEALSDIFNESMHNVIPEITDIISNDYLKATYIINPDFSIIVVFATETAPKVVKRYIEM